MQIRHLVHGTVSQRDEWRVTRLMKKDMDVTMDKRSFRSYESRMFSSECQLSPDGSQGRRKERFQNQTSVISKSLKQKLRPIEPPDLDVSLLVSSQQRAVEMVTS